MLPSLLELKVTTSFCFPFKIPDDPTATINECVAEAAAFNHRDFNVQLGSKLTNGGYSASFFTAVDYIENPLRTKSFFRIILCPDMVLV